MNLPQHKNPKAADYALLRGVIDLVGYEMTFRMTCELMEERAELLRQVNPTHASLPMMETARRDIWHVLACTDGELNGV